MVNKELGSKPGFTPKAGAFGEAAAWGRELQKQGLLKSIKDKMEFQELVDRAYRDTMMAQGMGIDVGLPDELPEHSKRFPGATNADGTVNFSKS